MERKKHTLLVEVLYRAIKFITENDQPVDREIVVEVYTDSVTDDDYDTALLKADSLFKKIMSDGIEGKGGALIKSVITPQSILQIGVVDLDQFEAEQKIIQESAAGYEDKVKNLVNSIEKVKPRSKRNRSKR